MPEITLIKQAKWPFTAKIGDISIKAVQRLCLTKAAQDLDDERLKISAERTALILEGKGDNRTLRQMNEEEKARVSEIDTRLREIVIENFLERVTEWDVTAGGQPVPLTKEALTEQFGSDVFPLITILNWADMNRGPKAETLSS